MTLPNMRFASSLLAFVALLTLAPTGNASESALQDWINESIAGGADLAISAAHYKDGNVSYYSGGSTQPAGGESIDETTQFQIGSITKTFTNLLLAEMVARGDVDYDTTIGDILDGAVEFANPAVADITLMQLATHSSGLPRLPVNLVTSDPLNPYKGYDEEKLLAGVAMSRAQQPLGNHYSYSNFGVGLLGYLLGRVHGDGYHAALEALVLQPLGLEETGFDASNASAGFRGGEVVPDWTLDSIDGAGGLWSSASDLMRIAAIQLGDLDNPFKHAIDDDHIVQGSASPGFRLTRVWHAANSDDGTIYYHNGGTGGFWSFFGFRPASNEAIAVMVSGDTDPSSLGFNMLSRTAFVTSAAEIDDSVFGQYQLAPNVGVGVYAIESTLVGQVSGQGPLPLSAIGNDWYAVGPVDASIRFVRDKGQVVAMELAQNGVLQKAPRVAPEAKLSEREVVSVTPESLADFAGEYPLNSAVKFTIRIAGDGLQAQLTGQPFVPVYAAGEDVFFYKVVDAELRFERDASGTVNALVLHQGSIVQRAEKTP